MPEADTPQPRPSFPVTQRELVGLALQRGARRPSARPAAPGSQRDRVRQSLALGVGGPPKSSRRGAHR
ncbi:MAG TPA: hypothetical protein VHF51_17080 [Solirubrobacteraceae bacterium]|nr:hypothetical protein [Solirubrobacteraceae bacterium]